MSNLSEQTIYAILSDNVYWDVRKEETKNNDSNWTPVPDGWTIIDV